MEQNEKSYLKDENPLETSHEEGPPQMAGRETEK